MEKNDGRKKYLKPWIFGVIAGTLFVSAEAFLGFYPPSAYAFCLSCHTRDLINTLINAVFGTHFETAGIAGTVLMVTSPAVLIGACIAARLFKERKIQKATNPLLYFIVGFAIMIIGIVIFGCPTRIILRAGYGDVYALVALACMLFGIWCGTMVMKLRFRTKG